MKLQQGQIWNRGGEFLRIVELQRLEVEYKSLLDPTSRDGTHHRISKKEFCRLIKGASLLPVAETGRARETKERGTAAAVAKPAPALAKG